MRYSNLTTALLNWTCSPNVNIPQWSLSKVNTELLTVILSLGPLPLLMDFWSPKETSAQ